MSSKSKKAVVKAKSVKSRGKKDPSPKLGKGNPPIAKSNPQVTSIPIITRQLDDLLVQFFDTNYGIALDDDGRLFKVWTVGAHRDGEPFEGHPITLRKAIEWLAMMNEVDGVGSTTNISRLLRFILTKLPKGVA